MTDNIEQEANDFSHNTPYDTIIYRSPSHNRDSRINTLINELMRIPILAAPVNGMNHSSPTIPYDIFLESDIEYETINDGPAYKKVLSSEGEKSLKKIKYDKIKVEYDKCPILQCDFEPGEEITQLPCKHCFNTVAIERWLKEEKSECPVCRHQLEHMEKKINIDDEYNIDDNDNRREEETEYNFPVFNLINSLRRTSNVNNRNYYISTNEEDEIQEAIRLSLEN